MPLPSDAATTASPVGQAPATCQLVKAAKWNHLVRLERTLDGSSAHRLRKTPICAEQYKTFKRHVRKVRADCLRRSKRTIASKYSWGDSGGNVGACGRPLTDSKFTFAVLQTGNVWGAQIHSPAWLRAHCFQRLFVHGVASGRTASGVMYDTGFGGPARPGLDLFNHFADYLKISLGPVRYSARNCWAR